MASRKDVDIGLRMKPNLLTNSVLKQGFTAEVKRWFSELRVAQMEPNQACALALKLAAGMAEPPVHVDSLIESLEAADSSIEITSSSHQPTELAALQDAATKLYRFFSSPDSLHAAFWVQHERVCKSADGILEPIVLQAPNDDGITAPHAIVQDNDAILQAPHPNIVADEQVKAFSTQPSQPELQHHPDDGGMYMDAQSQEAGDTSIRRSNELESHIHESSSPTVDTGQDTDISLINSDATEYGVDFACINRVYSLVQRIRSPKLTTSLLSACERLLVTIKSLPLGANPGLLRQLLIVLTCPLLEDLDHQDLLINVCSAMVSLLQEHRTQLERMISEAPVSDMRRIVIAMQQYITITLYQQQAITSGIETVTKALGFMYTANTLAASRAADRLSSHSKHRPPTAGADGGGGGVKISKQETFLAYSEFYNDAVNNEDFNIKEDFRRWRSAYRTEFSFCSYPYVYDPASKARILQMECQLAQYNELQSALFRGIFASQSPTRDNCPFLVLKVRRGPQLVQDTLVQVHHAKEQGSLRKPLKVKFVGEEGVDEGGVQKEFFQLLVRELFNADYGMFVYDESVRLHWFRPSHIDMDTEFELVGILIGLAIYNSHILEFSFPMVLYKLLVGAQPTFDDLRELFPDIHASLLKLLAMTSDEVEACSLNFTVDVEYGPGEVKTIELLEGQGQVPVTVRNRRQYVQLYTQHLLQTSVSKQWKAFNRGFLKLCSSNALTWFRPEELELLICGSRSLDLSALQAATLYDDGYDRASQEIQWFWQVALALPPEQQKRLLAFATGSDRVPIKGLSALNPPFVISRMGGEPDRLPTAHTCFNHLLLPAYTSKEALQTRLEMALENAEGFGLM